jgi:rod shape-determining protein MreD
VRHILWALSLIVISLVLQTTLLNSLKISLIKPDLVLIVLVFFFLSRGPAEGMFLGFFGGLLQDILSGGILGISALVKALLGFLIGLLGKAIYKERILVQVLTLWGATLVQGLLFFLFLEFFSQDSSFLEEMKRIICFLPFYNAFLGLFIFYGLNKLLSGKQ